MFKKLFQLYFPPGTDPSYHTRQASLQQFQGGAQLPFSDSEKCPDYFQPESEEELRIKFKSMQVPEVLPSRVIRKLGGM